MDAKPNCTKAGDAWSTRWRRLSPRRLFQDSLAHVSRLDLERRPGVGVRAGTEGELAPGRIAKFVLLATSAMLIGCLVATEAGAANLRTRNFIVQAPSPRLAKAVGEAAERYRSELAVYWTGEELPSWPSPCPIRVVAGPNLAAQGVTTYNPAPVRDFQMEVVGSSERILDSVLPHEVTHTVLATYFGRPLPRWADEGICTTVEHESEKAKHEAKLREFLSTRRGIAMNRLFLLTEYPADVLPMYAQGYSVCRFLIDQKGPQPFIAFLKDYMRQPSWTANIQKHYGYDSLAELQDYWLKWVQSGSGDVAQFVKSDADSSPATASLAGLQSTRQSDGRRIAPATARLGRQGASRRNRGDTRRSEVADGANKGDPSWYGRTSANPSDAMQQGNADSSVKNAVSPAERVAAAGGSTGRSRSADARVAAGPVAPGARPSDSDGLSWAPPSVLSSGRYSVSQPQAESSRSLRSGSRWR